jgi:hypothetical protein
MPEKDNPNLVPAKNGLIHELVLRIKLFFLLFRDDRVNYFIKSIPLICMGYVLMPVNIPGPFDEIGVLLIGYILFVELCPHQVVEEHMVNLRNPTLSGMPQAPHPDSVIDADFKEVQDPPEGEENHL